MGDDLPLIIDLSTPTPEPSNPLPADEPAPGQSTILGSLKAYNHGDTSPALHAPLSCLYSDQPSPPAVAASTDAVAPVGRADKLLNEFTTSRRLPSPPVSSAPSSSAPVSPSPASSELSAYDAIARDFASSAGHRHGVASQPQARHGEDAHRSAQAPCCSSSDPLGRRSRSTAASFETMKQRVEAFSSRLSTESVKGWELNPPQRASAPMYHLILAIAEACDTLCSGGNANCSRQPQCSSDIDS